MNKLLLLLLLLMLLTGCSGSKETDNKVNSLGILPERFVEEFNRLSTTNPNKTPNSPKVFITHSEYIENGALFMVLSNRGDTVGMLGFINKDNGLIGQVTVIGPGTSIRSILRNTHVSYDEWLWFEAIVDTIVMFNRNGFGSMENIFERLDGGETLVSASGTTKFKLQKLPKGQLAFSITGIDNTNFGLESR